MNWLWNALEALTPTHLGVQNNRWLPWHMIGWASVSFALAHFGLSRWIIISICISGGVLYELKQTVGYLRSGGIRKHCDSIEAWFWDSFFDIFFPAILAWMIGGK